MMLLDHSQPSPPRCEPSVDVKYEHGDGQLQSFASPVERRHKTGFLSLPPEIHLEISDRLIYPDALSLKHTSRYFYSMVDTGVTLKIDWLFSRRKLHLECPNDKGCDLGSDLRFCRGSVALLMKRRREHIECDTRPGIGCIVYGTPSCSHRQRSQSRWRTRLHTKFTIELWWILVAVLPLLIIWLWTLASK